MGCRSTLHVEKLKRDHTGNSAGSAQNAKDKTWQVQDHSSLSHSSQALYHISLHKHRVWQQAKVLSFFSSWLLKRKKRKKKKKALPFERVNRNSSKASKTGWLLNQGSKEIRWPCLRRARHLSEQMTEREVCSYLAKNVDIYGFNVPSKLFTLTHPHIQRLTPGFSEKQYCLITLKQCAVKCPSQLSPMFAVPLAT